jgi:hypothetical protein
LISCKNDDNNDTPQNCGCDSETLFTIPNEEFEEVYGISTEEQMAGQLFYKHPEIIDGFYDYEEYNNKFWIFQGMEGCWNCRRVFIVCNENLIGEEFEHLKQEGVYDSIPVQFSGNVKRTCTIRHLPADMLYANWDYPISATSLSTGESVFHYLQHR